MRTYVGNGIGDMYFELVRDLTNNGREVSVRGQHCLEFTEPVTLVFERPGHCWMNIPGRKWNPFFALAEIVWILTGNGNVDWISYFNSNMRMFADEGKKEFHGAYGLRLRHWAGVAVAPNEVRAGEECDWALVDQIEEAVGKLRKDPYTRQAVISLWDPVRDNQDVSKDYPCNNLVYYSLRDELLEQTVVIRSNDLVWGTPYNAFQFSHLHALVAGEAGVDMGKFHYVIQNLHYYYDLYKPTLAHLLEKAFDGEPIKALAVPGFYPVTDAEIAQLRDNVESILKVYRDDLPEEGQTPVHFPGGGYWNQVISQMIWIYTVLRERKLVNTSMEYIAERVTMLGSPLVELILDFYSGTENVWAQTVVEECQKVLSTKISKGV
jgi:thymidylate synthase